MLVYDVPFFCFFNLLTANLSHLDISWHEFLRQEGWLFWQLEPYLPLLRRAPRRVSMLTRQLPFPKLLNFYHFSMNQQLTRKVQLP